MNFFFENKDKIRELLIAGCDYKEVASAINVKEKKLREFVQSSKSAREFWDSSVALQEDSLLSSIAAAKSSKGGWRASAWLLERTKPKKYSETGVRLQAEKPEDGDENAYLEETIRLRDSIIDKHYRFLDQGFDWSIEDGGSRSGKTYNVLLYCYFQTRFRKFDLSLIAPSHKMLERGMFDDMKRILSEFDPEIHIPERPTKLKLRNGSEWNFEVVLNENEAKRNRVNVVVDECDGITEIVANILGRASGRKIIMFNPVKKFWAHKKINEDGTNILKTSWVDNKYLTENQLKWFEDLKRNGEFAEEGSPERYAYEVYYLGNYSLLSGKAFELEDFDIIDEAPTDIDYYLSYSDPSLGVGADFFAGVLFGVKGKNVYVIDCIFSQYAKTSGYVEQLKQWDELTKNKADHYAEVNGMSGVVTRAANEMYDGILNEINNTSKKEADILVYAATAKKFKYVRSPKMMQFIDQCVKFPNDEHDDAPDALCRGAKTLLQDFDLY